MVDVDSLFDEYRQTSSRRIRNRIVEEHMGLVDYQVNRIAKGHTEADDVRQQALMALIGAVERFDPDKGVSFRTFANRTVEGELKRFRRDRGWSVRPPRSLQELSLLVRRAEGELSQKLGRTPRVDDIADHLDESTDRVLEALAAGGALQADSLDAPPPGDDTTPRGTRIAGGSGGYADVERAMLVDGVLEQLSDQDREILELRFRDRLTQQEISDHIGVSQSYLSRVLRRALERARDLLDDDTAV